MEEYRSYLDNLNMMPHPEGGFYRRNWESLISGDLLDQNGKAIFKKRKIGSSILYLLPAGMVCKWHRIHCDEMWHLYEGTPLNIHMLSPQKGLETFVLGPDIRKNQIPQLIIPRLTWFAAELIEPSGFAFCGCSLWPAFSYTDFELADPATLADDFPAHKDLIERIQNHDQ
jgi:uncharacterized protein